MAQRGLCSRREADAYIKDGKVKVDGEIISTLGTKISSDAKIELLSSARKEQEGKVTILLHKPLGYVSNLPEKGYPDALELITKENQWKQKGDSSFHPKMLKKLSVAGRLDINSKGLLVLTQDGTVAKAIIAPEGSVDKEYLVGFKGELNPGKLKKLRFGLSLDGKKLKKAEVAEIEPGLLKFTLREGKKRQIRRMCELVELEVVKLKRVRVGKIRLGKLPEGRWRLLRPEENF